MTLGPTGPSRLSGVRRASTAAPSRRGARSSRSEPWATGRAVLTLPFTTVASSPGPREALGARALDADPAFLHRHQHALVVAAAHHQDGPFDLHAGEPRGPPGEGLGKSSRVFTSKRTLPRSRQPGRRPRPEAGSRPRAGPRCGHLRGGSGASPFTACTRLPARTRAPEGPACPPRGPRCPPRPPPPLPAVSGAHVEQGGGDQAEEPHAREHQRRGPARRTRAQRWFLGFRKAQVCVPQPVKRRPLSAGAARKRIRPRGRGRPR